MTKVLVVSLDTVTAVEIPSSGEEAYRRLNEVVGGYLELLPFGPQASAYVNEEGIALGLPQNYLATSLIRHFLAKQGRLLLPGDYIKGTLVVVGPPDTDGNDTSVPADVETEVYHRVAEFQSIPF